VSSIADDTLTIHVALDISPVVFLHVERRRYTRQVAGDMKSVYHRPYMYLNQCVL